MSLFEILLCRRWSLMDEVIRSLDTGCTTVVVVGGVCRSLNSHQECELCFKSGSRDVREKYMNV